MHVIVWQSRQMNGVSWTSRKALQAPVIIGEIGKKMRCNLCDLSDFSMRVLKNFGYCVRFGSRDRKRDENKEFLSRSGLYLAYRVFRIF